MKGLGGEVLQRFYLDITKFYPEIQYGDGAMNLDKHPVNLVSKGAVVCNSGYKGGLELFEIMQGFRN